MSAAQQLLRAATGLNLSRQAAERAVRSRMERTGAPSQDAYLARMTPDEMTALVELVVVPESWFFRDPLAFTAMADILRARGGGLRPARILSVPCAGGEEPYTIAMALDDAGFAPASFVVDAYDISPGCLARAQAGVYGRNAFRSRDLRFREHYFEPAGGGDYRIKDAIRQQVRFQRANLLELDTAGREGSYDVIFCRNLLIYFDKPTTAAAIARLRILLADDGVLFSGYAEVHAFCQNGFSPLPYAQAFGLRKDDAAGQATEVRALPSLAAPRVRRQGLASPSISPAAAAPHVGGPGLAEPGSFTPRQSGPRMTGARMAGPGATSAVRGPAAPTYASSVAPPAPGAARVQLARGPAPSAAAPSSAVIPPPGGAAGQDRIAEARRLADSGRLSEAEALCRAQLEQAPDTAEAYFILGLVSELGGKSAESGEHLRRCIYLQPDHYDALCHLALLAEAGGDSASAATLKARAARIYQRRQANGIRTS
ncbi:CheR family methyltransferase [Oxalobacteraceae bacterium A2-2]